MTIIYLDRNKWFEFPADVAVCPICGAPVIVNFDEWKTETGMVTKAGFHINCKDEPEMEWQDEWNDWFYGHWSMPYMDWLPLENRLYKWFTARYRLADS